MENTRREFLKNFFKSATALAAITIIQPVSAALKQDDFVVFMKFSELISEEKHLSKEYGELCWRYTQQHSKPEHIQAMHRYVDEPDPTKREQLLSSDVGLKSIAYHTLYVWFTGDVTSLNPTKADVRLAHFSALKWNVMGTSPRGICNPNGSQACTT